MLRQLLLSEIDTAESEPGEGWTMLAAEFPTVAIQPLRSGEGAQVLCLNVEEWQEPGFDPLSWDPRVFSAADSERLALHLVGAQGEPLARAALEILTRYQGLINRRNAASSGELFDRILERHRAHHDLNDPLVHADHQHGLNAWQWVLRLQSEADLAVQVAALFHDSQRLRSEADAHAALVAEFTCTLLEELKVDPTTCERVRWLVTQREHPEEDPALALLNEADALSFFSLSSSGFARDFSLEHTGCKVAHTLARVRPEQRARLEWIRSAPMVRALLDAHLHLASPVAREGAA